MSQLSADEAIRKKVPKMSYGQHRDAKIIDEKCPECGGPILCVYDDLGLTDYDDNYAHICLNSECDFFDHAHFLTLGVGGRQDPPSETCHFCNREVKVTG